MSNRFFMFLWISTTICYAPNDDDVLKQSLQKKMKQCELFFSAASKKKTYTDALDVLTKGDSPSAICYNLLNQDTYQTLLQHHRPAVTVYAVLGLAATRHWPRTFIFSGATLTGLFLYKKLYT